MMKKIDMHVHCAPPGNRFASPDDIRPMYEQWIEQGNLHVCEGKVFEPSLNDIFVEYAGDGSQED